MTPGPQPYLAPSTPKRPAIRLVVAVGWLAAAGLAVGATFGGISRIDVANTQLFLGFWEQYQVTNGQERNRITLYLGVPMVVGAAFILLAALFALLAANRWRNALAGAFGTGMVLSEVISRFSNALAQPATQKYTPLLGLWLALGAAVLGIVVLVLSLLDRPRAQQPVQQPRYAQPLPRAYPPPPHQAPPPQAQPQPRWEPETPKYGIPVQQPPAPEPNPEPHPEPTPEPAPQPQVPLEAEPTTSIDPPQQQQQQPDPGSITRKLDGDKP